MDFSAHFRAARSCAFILSGLAAVFMTTSLQAVADPACRVVLPGPGFYANGMKYVLTPQVYLASATLPQEIRAAYGDRAQLADWQALKVTLTNPAVLAAFIAETGIVYQPAGGPCNNVFVSVGGNVQLNGGIAFLSRHDKHDETRYYKVFDTIDEHRLDLGRWTYPSQALVAISDGNESSQESVFNWQSFFNQSSENERIGLNAMLVSLFLLVWLGLARISLLI